MKAPAHGFACSTRDWQAWLNTQLSELLDLPADEVASLSGTDNLLAFGLDSIRLMSLQTRLQALGRELAFSDLSQTPTLDAWLALLAASPAVPPSSLAKTEAEAHTTAVAAASAPFPLTSVQQAYWLGRGGTEPLGHVSCHAFLVFHARDVDAPRLEHACDLVRERHPMLRAIFTDDGQQHVMDTLTRPAFVLEDWRSLAPSIAEQRWQTLWHQRSHESLDVARGQVFLMGLARMPSGEDRLWLSLDLLAADVESLRILMADLGTAYAAPHALGMPPRSRFEAHVRSGCGHSPQQVARDRAHWLALLDTLPAGPALPLACPPESIRQPVFNRRTLRLPQAELARLEAQAAQTGLTLASVFGAAFAAVLARWSEHPRLLLNVPVFNRREHDDLDRVIGDFTQLLLLPCEARADDSFMLAARRFQGDLHTAISHNAYPAVDLLREARRRGHTLSAPVVFSFNLGAEPFVPAPFRAAFGDLQRMISQTPQVWLDHQVYRTEQGCLLAWDSVDALFPAGLVDDMFNAYAALLQRLCDTPWHEPVALPLPAHQQQRRQQLNAQPAPGPQRCLHEDFFTLAERDPFAPALYTEGPTTTRGELRHAALCVAGGLRAAGVRPGDAVEVSLPRGADQIAAVLGVLAAGACYVPIDPSQPAARRARIRASAGIRAIISAQPDTDTETPLPRLRPQDLASATPLPAPWLDDPRQSAYVIYTSGSTGIPKGVEVSHAAAQNTLDAVHDLLSLQTSDRLLAVSALDFDLSVFDIFGLLGAGGSLVLLSQDSARDPHHWLSLARSFPPTIWNSAPALLEMMLALPDAAQAFTCLRASLLSGDWIRQDLPERMASLAPAGHRFHALGGATEAGVWSNVHVADAPLPGWRSIPYGVPLAGQAFRVVNALGRDAPDGVPGELWIGGASLARAYRGDPELTAQRFVHTAELGRWYRTGDRGRYHPDGVLEFLGRTDQQIKLRGVRIELGEVESALQAHPAIDASCAWVQSQPSPRLVAAMTIKPVPSAPEATATPRPAWPLRSGATCTSQALDAECRLVAAVLQPLVNEPAVAATPAGTGWTQWLRTMNGSSRIQPDPPLHLTGWTPEELTALRHRLRAWALAGVQATDAQAQAIAGDILLDAQLAPQALAATWVRGQAALDAMATALHALRAQRAAADPPLRVAIHAVRAGHMLQPLLGLLDQAAVCVTLMDESATLLAAAAARFERQVPSTLRWSASGLLPLSWVGRFDLVLSFAALHPAADVPHTPGTDPARGTEAMVEDVLWTLSMLLRDDGHLLLADLLRDSPLRQLTQPLLTSTITADRDAKSNEARQAPRFTDPALITALPGLCIEPDSWRDDALFFLHARSRRVAPEETELARWLEAHLPAAMRPDRLWLLRTLPLNANGKVDRRRLSMLADPSDTAGPPPRAETADRFVPQDAQEAKLLSAWLAQLGLSEETPVAREENFFEMGGDSLGATRLLVRLREQTGEGLRAHSQHTLSLAQFYRQPTLAGLAQQIAATTTPSAPVADTPWTEGAL